MRSNYSVVDRGIVFKRVQFSFRSDPAENREILLLLKVKFGRTSDRWNCYAQLLLVNFYSIIFSLLSIGKDSSIYFFWSVMSNYLLSVSCFLVSKFSDQLSHFQIDSNFDKIGKKNYLQMLMQLLERFRYCFLTFEELDSICAWWLQHGGIA